MERKRLLSCAYRNIFGLKRILQDNVVCHCLSIINFVPLTKTQSMRNFCTVKIAKNFAVIGIGSCCKMRFEALRYIEDSIELLSFHTGRLIRISSLYETKPSFDSLILRKVSRDLGLDEPMFYSSEQSYEAARTIEESELRFLNAAVLIDSHIECPKELLMMLHHIEEMLGRCSVLSSDRVNSNSIIRPVDLDLLFFNDYISEKTIDTHSSTVVPHRHIAARNFVLFPLRDIIPDYVHPVFKKSVNELLEDNITFAKKMHAEGCQIDGRWAEPLHCYVVGNKMWTIRDKMPHIMGICNITPDSFSDGGKHKHYRSAVRHALKLIESGAEIVDIGGFSSSPGRELCSEEEEMNRIIDAITEIRQVNSDIIISVDTKRRNVFRAALHAGANLLNDISAVEYDPSMLHLLRENRISVICMHSNNSDETIDGICKSVDDVCKYLKKRCFFLQSQGIPTLIIYILGISMSNVGIYVDAHVFASIVYVYVDGDL